MERQFTLYEIKTPYERSYIGITSQSLPERLRQHISRANSAPSQHPFYADIRKCRGEGVTINEIAKVGNIFRAKEAERSEIQSRRGENLYNLSDGGELDAGTGGRVFYERLNADPERKDEYFKKLSETKKAADWSDYDDMGEKAADWRKQHPREAYKQARRASRIARKEKPIEIESVETLEQKKRRLLYKYRRSKIARENAQKQWATKTPDEKAETARKISEKAKARMAALTLEQRQSITQKARTTRLKKYMPEGEE